MARAFRLRRSPQTLADGSRWVGGPGLPEGDPTESVVTCMADFAGTRPPTMAAAPPPRLLLGKPRYFTTNTRPLDRCAAGPTEPIKAPAGVNVRACTYGRPRGDPVWPDLGGPEGSILEKANH